MKMFINTKYTMLANTIMINAHTYFRAASFEINPDI